MNDKPSNNLVSANKSEEVLVNEVGVATDNTPELDGSQVSTRSTYDSLFWLLSYSKLFVYRFAKDLFISLLGYVYSGQLLPNHIVDLMNVQNNLRRENEPHTVTCKLSETSLDAHIPSYPGSPRSLHFGSDISLATLGETDPKLKKAVNFLHQDTDFLMAAEIGDVRMLEILISKEVNKHQIDHLGRNALHLAVCSNYENAVLLLLKAGINPNVKDNLGMTPLSLCLMRRPSLNVVQMLFDYGAKILPRSCPMDTGLFLQFVIMCTPTEEEENILRYLVEQGALITDAEAPGGRQALHFAAMSNNCKLIHILMDLGADLLVVNHRNETPKEVAITFKCKEALALLEQLEEKYAIRSSNLATSGATI